MFIGKTQWRSQDLKEEGACGQKILSGSHSHLLKSRDLGLLIVVDMQMLLA